MSVQNADYQEIRLHLVARAYAIDSEYLVNIVNGMMSKAIGAEGITSQSVDDWKRDHFVTWLSGFAAELALKGSLCALGIKPRGVHKLTTVIELVEGDECASESRAQLDPLWLSVSKSLSLPQRGLEWENLIRFIDRVIDFSNRKYRHIDAKWEQVKANWSEPIYRSEAKPGTLTIYDIGKFCACLNSFTHDTVRPHLLEMPEHMAVTWIWSSSMSSPDTHPVTTRLLTDPTRLNETLAAEAFELFKESTGQCGVKDCSEPVYNIARIHPTGGAELSIPLCVAHSGNDPLVTFSMKMRANHHSEAARETQNDSSS